MSHPQNTAVWDYLENELGRIEDRREYTLNISVKNYLKDGTLQNAISDAMEKLDTYNNIIIKKQYELL